MTTQSALRGAPEQARQSNEGTGQATVRRLYVYLVILISSTAGLFAFSSLVDSLIYAWFSGPGLAVINGPGFQRTAIASNVGLLVVTTPIFLLHWGWVQARAMDPAYPEERKAALRKFFLYVASAIALGLLLSAAQNLLGGIAHLALGQPLRNSQLLPGVWLYNLITIGVSGALFWYWQTVARGDGDFGLETGWAAAWRRLFLAGIILSGLGLILFGSANVISALLQRGLDLVAPSIGRDWFALVAGDGLSQVLIGVVLARTGLQVWHDIVMRRPAEEQSALLRLFLYIAAVGGAVATLVPATLALRTLLIWAFAGFNQPLLTLLETLIGPLALIPAGAAIWWRFWNVIQAMEARSGVRAEGATVRRIYFYAVAATGLVLLWLGLNNVVQVLLDLLLTAGQTPEGPIWQQPLATGLSLLVVGAPVWALHWRAVQAVALGNDEAGAHERASLPRRIYLYGVAFAGAILILFYLAQVLYRVFLVLLGDRTIALFSPEMAEDLARAAIAAYLWGVHLVALRTDGRRADQADHTGKTDQEDAPAALDPAQRRATLDADIAAMEHTLAQLRAERAALDDA
jgi:hypothetical protein